MKNSKFRKSNIPIQNHLKGKAKRQAKQTQRGNSILSYIKPQSKYHN